MGKIQQLLLVILFIIGSYFAGHGLAEGLVSFGTTSDPSQAVVVDAKEQLNFALKNEQDTVTFLKEAQGNKPAFVYFFAADCPHCIKLLKTIGEVLPQLNKEGIQPIGVDALGPNGGQAQLTVVQQQYNLPTPIFGDVTDQVSNKYGVGDFTIFLVGSDSNIYLRRSIGAIWPEDIVASSVLQKVKLLDQKNVDERIKLNQSLVDKSNEFTGTIISEQQNLFPLLSISLIALTILSTIIALCLIKKSWLPLLAGISLLLIGITSSLWVYWPANILLIIAATSLMTGKKQALWASLIVNIAILASLTIPILRGVPLAQYIKMQQTLWQFAPQIVLSLLLFQLTFVFEQEKYQKTAYAREQNQRKGADNLGLIAVHNVSKPERCEICHQLDQFDLLTNYCARCQQYTT